MPRKLLLALAAGLCLAAFAVAPALAQTPQAGTDGTVGIRLVDAPTDRADDPRARVYIVDHLKPGAEILRRVEVRNDTDRAMTLELYAAGATVEGGSFRFAEGRAQNDLASWVSLDTSRVQLAPGEQALVGVTVRVPADASEGERYGMVWVELPPMDGGQVAIVNRVGIRLYLSVGPGGEPPSDFSVDMLTASRTIERLPVVQATVTNNGGRALDLNGELLLEDGPAGLAAGPFDAELGTTLAPGQSAPVTIELDPELPDGPWQATLSLRSGTIERAVSGVITFPADVAQAESVVPADITVERADRVPPGLVALALGLLLFLLFLLFLLVWRRRRRDDEDDDEKAVDSDGDNRPARVLTRL